MWCASIISFCCSDYRGLPPNPTFPLAAMSSSLLYVGAMTAGDAAKSHHKTDRMRFPSVSVTQRTSRILNTKVIVAFSLSWNRGISVKHSWKGKKRFDGLRCNPLSQDCSLHNAFDMKSHSKFTLTHSLMKDRRRQKSRLGFSLLWEICITSFKRPEGTYRSH